MSVGPGRPDLFRATRPRRGVRLTGVAVVVALAVVTGVVQTAVRATDNTADNTAESRQAGTRTVTLELPLPGSAAPPSAVAVPVRLTIAADVTPGAPNALPADHDDPVADLSDAAAPDAQATKPRPELASATAAEATAARMQEDDMPAAALPGDQQDALPAETTVRGRWHAEEVRRNDTLSAIFKRLGLAQKTLVELLRASPATRMLERVRPGQQVRVRTADEDGLLELAFAPDPLRTLHVARTDAGWQASLRETPTETHIRFVGALINDSLYASALQAGLDDRLIMELAGIFGWDVDFALDIRAGDHFAVLHEEVRHAAGDKLVDGPILAATFTNRGKTFSAIRYQLPDGRVDYFSPEGYSMRKAFLRSPVDFRRISSRFRGERFHPVLGVRRPHRGVDYAAATGTPIKAAGHGKVLHAGVKGGYGKTVILQHGGRYQTLYAHMSRYAGGLKQGRRVRQGEVIGYVGSTGLATGPHLHYEFRVDGVHRDPLTVPLPKADPIDRTLLAEFQAVAAPLLARLTAQQRLVLASAESELADGTATR